MGAPTDRAPLPSGTVTLVFTDIEGSTQLLHDLGETYGQVLADHHRLLHHVWSSHEGVEVATEGDAFFVAFTSPSAAVRAVGDAQRRLAGHTWPDGRAVPVRMGVHTGEPQERDGTYWGIDVHYAARLCSAAHGDQVLVSATTRALVPDVDVDDLGEHALKDFATPRRIFHLVIDGRRSEDFPAPRTLEAAHTNLPSIAQPLLGRNAELADLRRRLTGSGERLVTLIGAGGSGKTRIAIACGTDLLPEFEDGVFLVALAPVPDPGGVPGALAQAIAAPRQAEIGPEAAVLAHLRTRRALLVIDNFEHVLDAAPLIGRLLDVAPGVQVLATSQAPLRLAAEAIVPVEPLGLPDPDEHDVGLLAGAPAVELFVERARAADPGFTLTVDNSEAVAELCRRLDGLPLALELAAARVRMASPNGLLDALTRGVDALGRGSRDMPERQRGLRAALDWTVSLLDEEQRELFAGLGVFADAWTIEEAERVLGGELDLWEAMATLIDFSLVRTRGDGRLTMAERVRTHARELLAPSGREHELRARHAALMAETAEGLSLELGLDVGGTIARTRDLLDELEQALSWSRSADPELYRRLLGGVGRPIYFAARLPSIASEITRLARDEDGRDVISGRLMLGQAMVAGLAGDMDELVCWTARAIDCHRRTADRATLLTTMSVHAHMLTLAERAPDSRACIAEALELAAEHPDRRVREWLEGTLAFAAVADGNYDEAEARLQATLAHPERTDFASAASTSYLADCALGRGDPETALRRYAEALEQEVRNTDDNNSLLQLIGIAASLAELSRDEEAAFMVGAIEHASDTLGIAPVKLFGGGVYARPIAALEARLGPDAWARGCQPGRQLTFEQAIDVGFELATVSR
jgi:predicted ATPase/class 3 adenylate cyclase